MYCSILHIIRRISRQTKKPYCNTATLQYNRINFASVLPSYTIIIFLFMHGVNTLYIILQGHLPKQLFFTCKKCILRAETSKTHTEYNINYATLY